MGVAKGQVMELEVKQYKRVLSTSEKASKITLTAQDDVDAELLARLGEILIGDLHGPVRHRVAQILSAYEALHGNR